MKELMGAITRVENGHRPPARRLLSDAPLPAHFCLVCFIADPFPEPWAGPGPLWTHMGPRVMERLPAEAMAAHLGGGYLGVLWSGAHGQDVHAWVEGLVLLLREACKPLQINGGTWSIGAGIAFFPEDFYDDRPALPWQKAGDGGAMAPAEEVVRRATLAAATALRQADAEICSCKSLREQGLIPSPGSLVKTRLSACLTGVEPCALLMVKLDGWEGWQRVEGSRHAERRASQVLEIIRGCCPEEAVVEWAGPEKIAVFLAGSGSTGAEAQARTIRKLVRSELATTVSIGIGAHPCPGFSKSDILDNARKALVHTGFFGPDTQTLFDAVSLNISGDRLYEAGRTEEAMEEFHRALLLDPDNVNARNSLGVCYAQLGTFEEAVAEFSRVVSLDSSDFMPFYNLGCALLNLQRDTEAARAFTRAAELEPENPGAWFQLAKLCRDQGRREEALAKLRWVVKLKPKWSQAWRLLGECLLELGAEREAMDAFKKTLRLNSKDAGALSGLAVVYGQKDANMEIALSLARRGAELEPDDPLVTRRLAELLLQNQELDEALAQCERALAIVPEDEHLRLLRQKIAAAQRASIS